MTGTAGVCLRQLLLQLQAAHVRDTHFQNRTAGTLRIVLVQKILGQRVGLVAQLHTLHQTAHSFARFGVTVDNKYGFAVVHGLKPSQGIPSCTRFSEPCGASVEMAVPSNAVAGE